MQIRNPLVGLILSVLMMTLVAFARDVSTDYDHKVDFSRYRTFAWMHPPMIADPLMRQRVEDAVNAQLREKGLVLVNDIHEADLGVMANGATTERHTLHTFYDGFPGEWRWGGWGNATTVVDTYQVGTLVVDLFDMSDKRVVWRGVATETVSDKPEKNSKKLQDAVEKMFKHFPPKLT
jgi:uncharacterized protein DUF4136